MRSGKINLVPIIEAAEIATLGKANDKENMRLVSVKFTNFYDNHFSEWTHLLKMNKIIQIKKETLPRNDLPAKGKFYASFMNFILLFIFCLMILTASKPAKKKSFNTEITVTRELYAKAPDKKTSERRSQYYVNGTGLKRVEHRRLQRSSDWADQRYERYSDDNGQTWGEWVDIYSEIYEKKGDDEINTYHGIETYNPRYGHFVSIGMRRIFFGGHEEAYKEYRSRGNVGFVDHCLLAIRSDSCRDRIMELVKYEKGGDYDTHNWRDSAYINNNRAYMGNGVEVLDNGEILFPIAANIVSCCRFLDLDVNEVFPSCPNIMKGLIVVRGRFNESRGHYDLSFSRPVVISDLKSSRGVLEPDVVMLPSNRIVAVFRGSNVERERWNTRIEPSTPAHKWYCYSADGGKTFTDPVPWHFDNREVFYSGSNISRFVRSIKNGKVYWIGNISDHNTYGNHPRYPLVIAEVNDRGLLIKETLTIIDTRREGDAEKLQLSNFSILQDRETGLIELYLTKLGQRKGYTWWADSYRYFIDVDGNGAKK